MVINEHGHGVPAAWLLHKFEDAAVINAAIDSLALNLSGVSRTEPDYLKRVVETFCPKYFIIDASKAETNAIQSSLWGKSGERGGVPRAQVVYCLWHVKRAILKHFRRLVSEQVRGSVWRHVETILGCKVRLHRSSQTLLLTHRSLLSPEKDPAQLSELVSGFADAWGGVAPRFVAYMQSEWLTGDKLRKLIRCAIDSTSEGSAFLIPTTTSAIESSMVISNSVSFPQSAFSHSALFPPAPLLIRRNSPARKHLRGRRIDWLIVQIFTVVSDRYGRSHPLA